MFSQRCLCYVWTFGSTQHALTSPPLRHILYAFALWIHFVWTSTTYSHAFLAPFKWQTTNTIFSVCNFFFIVFKLSFLMVILFDVWCSTISSLSSSPFYQSSNLNLIIFSFIEPLIFIWQIKLSMEFNAITSIFQSSIIMPNILFFIVMCKIHNMFRHIW